jgi:hypothetical protein
VSVVPEIADLELVIRAPAAPAVTSFTEMGTAAQEMAARVALAAKEVIAQTDLMAKSAGQMAVAADEMALQASMDYAKMAEATTAASIKMEAATASAMASNEKLGKSMAAMPAHVGPPTKALGLVALGAAAVGVELVHMAGNFEASTTRLVTSAGQSREGLKDVQNGILDMASEVGNSAEELSRAMYTIESGGQHGANGLMVLRAAAEGAKAEGADLKVVADAVTSVLVDYQKGAGDAALVTSKLVAATSAGKTTFEELAGAMSSVLPQASIAKISLDDILGSLASMTVHGMSAQQAADNLTDAIRNMQKPNNIATKELALLGIASNQLADDLRTKGLSGTLGEISNAILKTVPPGTEKVILDLKTALNGLSPAVRELGMHLFDGTMSAKEYGKAAADLDPISAKQAMSFATLAGASHRIGEVQTTGREVMQNYSQALAKATGDATSMKVALMLTGENAGVTTDAIKTVAGAAVEAGNHVKGWGEIQGTFNQKLSQAKDGLGALGIEVGMKLLPHVTKLMDKLASGAQWLTKHETLATALAVALGVLTVAFTVATVAVWAMNSAFLANPITWIIMAFVVAIGLMIALIWFMVTHWKQSWEGWKLLLEAVWNWAVGAWHWLLKILAEGAHWVDEHVIKPVIDFFESGWSKVVGVWHWLNDTLHTAAQWLRTNVIMPIVQWVDQHLVKPFKLLMHGFSIEFQFIWGFLSVIIDDFKKVWAVVWKAISTAAQWAWDNVIKPVAKAIDDYGIKPIGVAIDWLGKAWDTAWAWISKKLDESWAAMKVVWGYIDKFFIKPIADAIHWVGQKWDEAWAWISKRVDDAWAEIKVIWGYIDTKGIKPIHEAISWLSTEWDKIWTSIKDTVTNIYNRYLKPIFDTIGGAIAGIIGGIRDIANHPFQSGQDAAKSVLPGHADGGWVPGAPDAPHLAIVHGGEFVLSRAMLAGQASIPNLGGAQSSGSGQPSVIHNHISNHIYIDGQELQGALMRSAGRNTTRNGNNGFGR